MDEPFRTLTGRIRTAGPLRFDDYVDAALYHPHGGFFTGGGGAGRSAGDFVTSPEVGPLFGALVARYLDRRWIARGRPHPFTVVEVGAGRGALAIAVRAAHPECIESLAYLLVERSGRLRSMHGEHLPLMTSRADGLASGFRSLAEMSEIGRPVDVIVANELLDNVAFRLLEKTGPTWSEIYVDLRRDSVTEQVANDGVQLVETLLPADGPASAAARRYAPQAKHGARIPLQEAACRWVDEAIDHLADDGGALVVVDYARDTSAMADLSQDEWLRTYRTHDRGLSVLAHPGSQDITCDVATDQMAAVEPWTRCITQSEWLDDLGIEELVAEGSRLWHERASSPDLEAIRGRSRVVEAEALLDPGGLGAFTVMEWVR